MNDVHTETFIRLYRKAQYNELFMEKPFDRWHAFEYLVMKACRFDKTEIIKGRVINLKRGQLLIGQRKMADTFGWSRNKVARFQELLEALKMATFDGATYGATIGTLVTVENYDRYQLGNNTNGATDGATDGATNGATNGATDGATNGATDGANINKDNKDKKVNKGNNNIFKPPTVQEVKAYCMERGNNLDAEYFTNFYAARGWQVGKSKMKDWRAAVRYWERNNNASKSTAQKRTEGRLDWIDDI